MLEEGKEYVNHIDENSTNNKTSNLEWCSQKENFQHAKCFRLGHQHAVKQIFEGCQVHAEGYRWKYINTTIHNKC
ncbi:hypothetical protein Glove_307g47 [Diversispora epigaea]|uniref:Uncharacterized protein n=1 Tax=Diversispora epigaea TaxID=1348612 RepID=A0A397HZ33_9GLOM|nr:hypothetical protein Glove_307g47 [Diversispora epigaea]